MKMLIVIVTALVLLLAVGWFFLKRWLRGMAGGAKIIIIMQRLHQFSADIKKQGTFTNDIPHLADIYAFTDTVTFNGAQHRCSLAAKSPSFGDGGVLAITTEDVVLWIARDGSVTPFDGADSVTP